MPCSIGTVCNINIEAIIFFESQHVHSLLLAIFFSCLELVLGGVYITLLYRDRQQEVGVYTKCDLLLVIVWSYTTLYFLIIDVIFTK